jgi:S1-C subfamily serine protease
VRWLIASSVVLAAGVIVAAWLRGADRVPPPPPVKPAAVVALSAAAQRATTGRPRALARDGMTRHAQRLTLRVRNISCAGVGTGSGWAIDEHTLITNRHVLAGAAILELNAWDGTSIDGDVGRAQVGRLVDIGIASISQPLPAVANTGPRPRPEDRVTAVGYPLGGRLTLSRGRVVRYLDGRTLSPEIAYAGEVMQLTTTVKHGNSGGPLLDRKGRVVGLIYAGEPGADYLDDMRVAYAIPLSEARKLLRAGGTQSVLPCAQ